jgi:hypothetical protein
MLSFDQSPTEEDILNALKLTRAQFRSGYSLTTTPAGLPLSTLRQRFKVSDDEIEELVRRHFIVLSGDHFHVTRWGAGVFLAAASGWIEAAS